MPELDLEIPVVEVLCRAILDCILGIIAVVMIDNGRAKAHQDGTRQGGPLGRSLYKLTCCRASPQTTMQSLSLTIGESLNN